MITDTQSLRQLVDELKAEPFVTVDTEFMREKTYWPKLCLVQLAGAQRAAAARARGCHRRARGRRR